MAEVAGLAVGVAGLASLFKSCVDCFDMIQMGRTLSRDLAVLHQRLDNQKMRFVIWGQSMGLDDEDSRGAEHLPDSLAPLALTNMKHTMQLVINLLEDGEALKTKYGLLESPRKELGSPQICIREGNAFALALKRVRIKLSSFKSDRNTASPIRWVCLDRRQFGELVDNLKALIDDLESLASSKVQAERRQQIVEYEIEELPEEELEIVMEAGSEVEDSLSDAASSRIERITGTSSRQSDISSLRSVQSSEQRRSHIFDRGSTYVSIISSARSSGANTQYYSQASSIPSQRSSDRDSHYASAVSSLSQQASASFSARPYPGTRSEAMLSHSSIEDLPHTSLLPDSHRGESKAVTGNREFVESMFKSMTDWNNPTVAAECLRKSIAQRALIYIEVIVEMWPKHLDPNIRTIWGSPLEMLVTKDQCNPALRTFLKHPRLDINSGPILLHALRVEAWKNFATLIDHGPVDVRATDEEGINVIMEAASRGHDAIIEPLLSLGPIKKLDLWCRDRHRRTAFDHAVSSSNLKTARSVMAYDYFRVLRYDDLLACYCYASYHDLTSFTSLSQTFAQWVKASDRCKRLNRIFYEAVVTGRGMIVRLMMFIEEVHVNRPLVPMTSELRFGETPGSPEYLPPLLCAVKKGHADIVRFFLRQSRVDRHVTDDRGRNALLIAIAFDQLPICELILRLNIDLDDSQDLEGSSAVMVAVKEKRQKHLRLLLQHSSGGINTVDKTGLAPIHVAVRKNSLDMVRDLLGSKDIDTYTTYDGKTPLDIAIDNMFSRIAKELTDHSPKLISL